MIRDQNTLKQSKKQILENYEIFIVRKANLLFVCEANVKFSLRNVAMN